MTRDEAMALGARLEKACVDHQVRARYMYGMAHWSVRAMLGARDWGRDKEDRRAYTVNAFFLMTETGDWDVGGEGGEAYVVRY